MSFEGPKATSIYYEDPGEVKIFLEGKTDNELRKMIEEPYTISGVIRDALSKDPTSRSLNRVNMSSKDTIKNAAQAELEKRSSSAFFAV